MLRLVATCGLLAWTAMMSVPHASSAAPDAVRGAGSHSAELVIGFFEGRYLRNLDPITLEAVGPRVPLGEYHGSPAISPDRSRLALGTGGPGGGVTIFGLPHLEELHRVSAGIAPEALAWLSPTRVAAALQCVPTNNAGRGCGVVLVDGNVGRIVGRWPDTEDDTEFLPFQPPVGLGLPKPVAVTPHGVVFLLAHWSRLAPARVVFITREEELRSASLSGIELASGLRVPPFRRKSGGLAVDASGQRAFIVGVQGTVAEVDLETLHVRHREIEALKASPQGGRRAVVPLDQGRLAMFGDNFRAGEAGGPSSNFRSLVGVVQEPAGVTVIDTESWTARTVDPQASRAAFAAGTLLVYGGRSSGVTGYSSDGRRRFHLFGDETEQRSVAAVHAHGGLAYVVTQSGDATSTVTVIDAATGTIEREANVPGRLFDLIALPAR